MAVGHDRARLRPGEDRRPDQPRRVLYDPKYKGKVDYLTEMRDTIGLTMLKLGLDPSKATTDDCDAAIAEIKKAVDAGIVRAFKGNEYAEDLISRRRRPVDGLVGRHGPGAHGQEDPALHDRRPGRHALDRQLHDPEGRQERVHGRRS